jgi:ABC-2 type transport system permease protein
MNKTLLVLRNEIVTILTRPSFLFALFGIPVIGAAVFLVAGQLNKGSSVQNLFTQLTSNPQKVTAEGYVDLSGIIKVIPNTIPAGTLISYPDETSASQALNSNKISGYYIIAPDYIQTGKITAIRTSFNPIASAGQGSLLEYVLKVNLLGGNAQLASLLNGPTNLEPVPLSNAPQREQSNMLTFFLPYAVTMLFYFIILSSASLLLSSVTKEKENRVLEILMLSVTPRQLLTGKIAGLGLVGLLQTIVWVGTGRLLLAQSGTTFNLSSAFQLPPSFLIWGVVFFLLGYAVYASLMAGLGALVPNMREASQATILVIFPLIIPIFLLSVLINDSNGLVATILSLFPLTSPVTMMLRLSAATVPFWQTLLSAVLLAATAMLIIRAVARMFHAQTLLSGQTFSRKLFFDTLLGKSI